MMFATCFHAGFLLGLLVDPDDGGDVFLRNVGWLSTGYIAFYPRRHNSSRYTRFAEKNQVSN
jgi:hypothetical protein